MVDHQIKARGVSNPMVLKAMMEVPRHIFAPGYDVSTAYADMPLPIGHEQTISQPYIVAFMTEAARLTQNDRVLEIGTGSGYQAAVLASVVKEVYTVETIGALNRDAEQALNGLGLTNIYMRVGNGYAGWREKAPFDAILVTAAPEHVPQELLEQLKIGGRMIIPVGTSSQELIRITKEDEVTFKREDLLPVRFVPMTGS